LNEFVGSTKRQRKAPTFGFDGAKRFEENARAESQLDIGSAIAPPL
jgi:hypothetical protein